MNDMVILLLVLMLLQLIKKANIYEQHYRFVIYFITFVSVVGLILYRSFLEYSAGWEYGISGADMEIHFDGAKLLANGMSWNSLSNMATRFEELGIGTIGYFLYTQFLSFTLFKPVLLDIHVNIYIFTTCQCIAAMIVGLNFESYFCQLDEEEDYQRKGSVLFAFLCFALSMAYLTASYRLLREIWAMYLFSEALIISSCSKEKKALPIALSVVSVLLRPYMILLIIPLLLKNYFNIRMRMICSVVFVAIMIFAATWVSLLAPLFGITWGFASVDIGEVIHFILFPNIINQSKILWTGKFSSTNYLGGVNVPTVDYFQAVWNAYIVYVIIWGILLKRRCFRTIEIRKNKVASKKTYESIMWFCILMSVCMLYSIVYQPSTMMIRHKIMIIPSLVYFARISYNNIIKYTINLNKLLNLLFLFLVIFLLLYST